MWNFKTKVMILFDADSQTDNSKIHLVWVMAHICQILGKNQLQHHHHHHHHLHRLFHSSCLYNFSLWYIYMCIHKVCLSSRWNIIHCHLTCNVLFPYSCSAIYVPNIGLYIQKHFAFPYNRKREKKKLSQKGSSVYKVTKSHTTTDCV